MSDLETYPDRLRGGRYDGARLVGTLADDACADYYNASTHGLVRYSYDAEDESLHAAFDPERPLPDDRSLADHLRRRREAYDALTPWARKRVDGTE